MKKLCISLVYIAYVYQNAQFEKLCSIALHILWPRRQTSWIVNATPRPLYPRERPDTHSIGGWIGPTVGLEGWGRSRHLRDSILGPSSP